MRKRINTLIELIQKQMIRDMLSFIAPSKTTVLQSFRFTDRLKYHMHRPIDRYEFYLLVVEPDAIFKKNTVMVDNRTRTINLIKQAVEIGELDLLEVEKWLLDKM